MTIDQWAATFSATISFLGLLLVVLQLREGNRQAKLESQIRLYDINRELITLGFSKPELFQILADAKNVDSTIERRYLQLWLNQLCLVDSFKRSGAFNKEVQEGFETDLRDMMQMENMRRHWHEFERYYPASFRKSVTEILDKAERKRTKKKGGALTI